MKEEKEKELYETYMAQVAWTTATIIAKFGGGELGLPQYVELTHPEMKKSQPTADEIKKHLLERLR